MPSDLHQAVAVSDAVLRDPHPFARPWEDPAERASTLAAMAAMAKPRVTAYLAENRLVPSTVIAGASAASQSTEGIAADTENGAGAAPTLQRGRPTEYGGSGVSSTAKSGSAASSSANRAKNSAASSRPSNRAGKPSVAAPLSLREEQVSGYTLSYGGLPTFVYSASVPAAVANAGALSAAAAHMTAYVTVVAQRLPSGELQVALGAVTDSQHLDPWAAVASGGRGGSGRVTPGEPAVRAARDVEPAICVVSADFGEGGKYVYDCIDRVRYSSPLGTFL